MTPILRTNMFALSSTLLAVVGFTACSPSTTQNNSNPPKLAPSGPTDDETKVASLEAAGAQLAVGQQHHVPASVVGDAQQMAADAEGGAARGVGLAPVELARVLVEHVHVHAVGGGHDEQVAPDSDQLLSDGDTVTILAPMAGG